MELSIIIPTLNEEHYLPLLLKSIKKQTFTDYEIIVADAGSQDKTVTIAQSFGGRLTKGGLPAQGRNEGAKIARGNLFLFTDADNIFTSPNFLYDLIKQFRERNLGSASFLIYSDGNRLDKILYLFYNLWVKLTQNLLPHATNSVLVRRDIHQKIGGFDEKIKIAEDQEYVRRAVRYGKFGFIEVDPVLNSCRRYRAQGRIKTYLKYFLSGMVMFFSGPIKSDIFKYRFDYQKVLKKNNNK